MVEARAMQQVQIQIVVLLPWYSPYPYKKCCAMLTIVSMQQITLPESAHLYAVLQNEE